jgi:hypothetical protein
MLTLDTSGVIAAADRRDRHHDAVTAAMADGSSMLIPASILAETTYMLRRRLGALGERAFLEGLIDGEPLVDHEDRLLRVVALIAKYADLDLSFADAAVVACAERHGGTILTLDRRDFDVVARGEGSITLVP